VGCIRTIHGPHPSGSFAVQIGFPADLSNPRWYLYRAGRRWSTLGVLHFGQDQPDQTNTIWRKRWDSNPRWYLYHAGFQDQCLKPLGHTSVVPHICRASRVTLALLRASCPSPFGSTFGRSGSFQTIHYSGNPALAPSGPTFGRSELFQTIQYSGNPALAPSGPTFGRSELFQTIQYSGNPALAPSGPTFGRSELFQTIQSRPVP
jgi:hypothetical protein